MDKISSIVPRSRRVSSVDLAAAPAVRPGAPAYGRPIGVSTEGARATDTTAQKAVAEMNRLTDERKASTQNADIVEQMANRFFLKNMSENLKPNLEPIPEFEAAPIGTTEPGSESHVSDFENSESDGPIDLAPQEYVPPGTYLDVSV